MRADLAHRGDELRVLRNPIRFDQKRLATSPGPGLGAHNQQLLGEELGLADQLEDLKRRRVSSDCSVARSAIKLRAPLIPQLLSRPDVIVILGL